MTRGLDIASQQKLKLYKKSLMPTSTEKDLNKYRKYRNIYNTLKSRTRKNYYESKCAAYKDNVKKLWSLINNTITKVKHKGNIILFINVNGVQQHHPKTIANSFGEFYSSQGKRLADKIVPGMTSISTHIRNIPRTVNSMALKAIGT